MCQAGRMTEKQHCLKSAAIATRGQRQRRTTKLRSPTPTTVMHLHGHILQHAKILQFLGAAKTTLVSSGKWPAMIWVEGEAIVAEVGGNGVRRNHEAHNQLQGCTSTDTFCNMRKCCNFGRPEIAPKHIETSARNALERKPNQKPRGRQHWH